MKSSLPRRESQGARPGVKRPGQESPSGHAGVEGPDQCWPTVLDLFDVQFLMLDTGRDAALLDVFQSHPGWRIDSQDDQTVLLARTDMGSSVVESKGDQPRDEESQEVAK